MVVLHPALGSSGSLGPTQRKELAHLQVLFKQALTLHQLVVPLPPPRLMGGFAPQHLGDGSLLLPGLRFAVRETHNPSSTTGAQQFGNCNQRLETQDNNELMYQTGQLVSAGHSLPLPLNVSLNQEVNVRETAAMQHH